MVSVFRMLGWTLYRRRWRLIHFFLSFKHNIIYLLQRLTIDKMWCFIITKNDGLERVCHSKPFPKLKDYLPWPSYCSVTLIASTLNFQVKQILYFPFIIQYLPPPPPPPFCQTPLLQITCWPLLWNYPTFQDLGQKKSYISPTSRSGKWYLSFPPLSQIFRDHMNPGLPRRLSETFWQHNTSESHKYTTESIKNKYKNINKGTETTTLWFDFGHLKTTKWLLNYILQAKFTTL